MKILGIALLILLAGCGGGPTGTALSATLVGHVFDVATGSPPSPAANVQVGSNNSATLADGSFTITVPQGTTQAQVTQSADGTFQFQFPAASGTVDIGEFWIGPQKITLHGTVMDGATNQPISGAAVSFGGITGTSASDGTFNLANVAYSNTNQIAFWGIVGVVQPPGYYAEQFTAGGLTAVASVVDVGNVFVTQVSGNNPPPPPFDIFGKILPVPASTGAVVTLSQNGSAVRVTTVANDGSYEFWVPAGTYSISAVQGALSAQIPSVIVASTSTPVFLSSVTLH